MTEIIAQTEVYVLPITPMPSPRPRARIVQPKDRKPFVSIYNPPEYMKWKDRVSFMVGELKIPKGDWNTINAVFYIPVPKSFSGKIKMNMHGKLHEQKPDWDNYVKALQDGIQMTSEFIDKFKMQSPISDDSSISTGAVRKVWINDPVGKIVFSLAKTELSPLAMMMS